MRETEPLHMLGILLMAGECAQLGVEIRDGENITSLAPSFRFTITSTGLFQLTFLFHIFILLDIMSAIYCTVNITFNCPGEVHVVLLHFNYMYTL